MTMPPRPQFPFSRGRALAALVAVGLALGGAGCEIGRAPAKDSDSASVAAPPNVAPARSETVALATGPSLDASASALPPNLAAPAPIAAPPARDVRMPSEWRADYRWSGSQRVAHAKSAKGAVVKELFDQAGVAFPPKDVLFRAYKKEREFEVWAGDGTSELKLIATWGICAASGELGPKRAEGDLQVPEGFYQVGYYHPESAYYLSAQVNYPNASDKKRGGPTPGGDILIHGACASIGCISMTDERIEEIYLIGWAAFTGGHKTHVHVFPARDFDALLADPKYEQHRAFWREIRVGHDAFEKTHRLPTITIDADGRYVVAE